MITIWKTISNKHIANLKILNAFSVKRMNPINEKISDFTVLESNDWVNIIPITKDNKIVLVEQYRHGIDEITFEIPGGLVDKNELPIDAAFRECMEETGFKGKGNLELLGVSRPNPAFLTNRCHTYLWNDCERISKQDLDTNEVINIHTVDIKEVKEMILSGKIDHSVILTAFYFYSLKKGF